MMKRLLILAFIALPLLPAFAQQQENHKKISIDLGTTSLDMLAPLGIDLSSAYRQADGTLTLELSATELEKMTVAGIAYQVLIDDMESFYASRFEAQRDLSVLRDPADEFPVPENWEYGSMGGMYTYSQVLDKLDFMAEQWPDLISVKQPINDELLSHNGNPVWYVKISDNPNENEDEPEVLYTGVIHAREGIGVQQMMYYMLYLLENYETNPLVKNLVDNREMYFVPIINPDGYLYNEQTAPNGGGNWRKNRRNNGGSYGVDLNRNYGYMWGLDNNGSSPDPTDATYRGPSAFSEPETQNMKQFVEENEFIIALNYHSYSNLLLYPWGYTDVPCPDDAIFYAHAALMTRDNNYTFGAGSTTIYPTNGGSDDWMYGETENKNIVFAYTPEVGNSSDGFWPSISRIIPLCQENMIQNIYAAWLAGSFGKLTETSPTVIGTTESYITFDLTRLGFGASEGWTVSISPLDDHIAVVGDALAFGSMEMLESKSDSILIQLQNDIQSGDEFRFLLTLDDGEYVISDTITKMYGTTTVVFEDDCDDFSNWTSSKWDVTQSNFHSPTGSITDSPFGEYLNNENNTITLAQPVELPTTNLATLSFWAKWEIESGYDYVQIQLRQDGAGAWIPLEGRFTKPGNSNQLPDQPLYDGNSDWVREEIDLTAYANSNIQLRFVLNSDSYVVGDGYYFDDVQLTILDIETAIGEYMTESPDFYLYPNPSTDKLNMKFSQALLSNATVTIVDQQGRVVQQFTIEANSLSKSFDINNMVPGMYFVRLSCSHAKGWQKIIIE